MVGHVVTQPDTRYAKSGAVSIAYQVVGDGSVDLVLVPGFVSHVEVAWEEPRLARFLTRLASFSRLIVFDKRSTGNVGSGAFDSEAADQAAQPGADQSLDQTGGRSHDQPGACSVFG